MGDHHPDRANGVWPLHQWLCCVELLRRRTLPHPGRGCLLRSDHVRLILRALLAAFLRKSSLEDCGQADKSDCQRDEKQRGPSTERRHWEGAGFVSPPRCRSWSLVSSAVAENSNSRVPQSA